MSIGRPSQAYTDDPDCWQSLANAIITQAAYNYRSAVRKLRRNPKDRDCQNEISDIGQFMHLRWFSILTEADGDYILRLPAGAEAILHLQLLR